MGKGKEDGFIINLKIILSDSFQGKGLPRPKLNKTNQNLLKILQVIVTGRIHCQRLGLTVKTRDKGIKDIALEDHLMAAHTLMHRDVHRPCTLEGVTIMSSGRLGHRRDSWI